MTRLLLVAHALTPALRAAIVGGDAEPDDSGLRAARAAAGLFAGADRVVTAPARAAVSTASAFGLSGSVEPALREREHGGWTGRRFDEIAAAEPDAVRRWLDDPHAAAPGGESVADLVDRVGRWLDDQAGTGGVVVAVTHPAVLRAAVVSVLGAPLTSYRQVDARPLGIVSLSAHAGRWHLTVGG